jgi:HK97 family phage major capsid protein
MSENQKTPEVVMGEAFASAIAPALSGLAESVKQQGEQFKSFIDIQAETKSAKEEFEVKSKSAKEEFEAKLEAEVKSMQAQIDELSAKKSVNISGATQVKQDVSTLECKMYNNLLQSVVKNVYNPEEFKSSVDDYCDAVIGDQKTSKSIKSAFQQVKGLHNVLDYSMGGHAVGMPVYLSAVQQLRQFSPLRDFAPIQVGKERDGYVEIIKASGRAQTQSLADTAYTSSESISVLQKQIKAALYVKVADVSDHLLNFAANPQGLINVINNDLLGAIGQGIGEDYILGKFAQDGAVTEPFVPTPANAFLKSKAIQYDADINKIGYIKSGDAGGITANAINSVKSKLASLYRAGAVYYMNGNTKDAIFTLKGTDGHYIFANYQNGLSAPDTLGGIRIIIDDNMPDIAPNTFPVAFVDLSRYYKIYDALFSNGSAGSAGGLVDFMPRTGKSAVSNFIAKAFTVGFVNDPQAAVFIKIEA